MAGFLNSLAARALGAMPLAEPVIPACFTPDSRGVSRPPFDSDSGPVHERAPEHPEPFNRAADQFARPAEIIPPETAPSERKQVSLSYEQRDEPPYLSQSTRNHTAQAASPERRVPRRLGTFPEPHPPEGDNASMHNPRAKGPGAPEKAIPADSFRDTQPNQPAIATSFAEPVQHSRPARPREHVRSQSESTLPLNPVTPNSTQPVVRVTIGRIEVRAEISAPQPSSASARPQRATLSLDQFLKQTGAGAR